jgi:hypothetical protein
MIHRTLYYDELKKKKSYSYGRAGPCACHEKLTGEASYHLEQANLKKIMVHQMVEHRSQLYSRVG